MRNLFLTAFMLTFLITTNALAHKVIASAWTDGADIEGEVGFSNGIMAEKGTLVEVFNDKDEKIGETVVGEEGLFRFTPTQAIAHKFVANLGAGHVAQYLMAANELPEGIGLKNTEPPKEAVKAQSDIERPIIGEEKLTRMIAKAVRKEVQPLRKEIAAYKEKNNFQSILGGIGYIFGLTGIVFYIMARRKEKSAP
ncbi:MAG: cobalt ABC transporter permease [Methylocystaceae bacterium]|nr:cobalt ABC transporter permease [Methylocystaceae bacterium]